MDCLNSRSRQVCLGLKTSKFRVQRPGNVSFDTGPAALTGFTVRKALPWFGTPANAATVVSDGPNNSADVLQEEVGTLLPTAALQQLSNFTQSLAYRLESSFPASKGEVKAETAALVARVNQQDAVINQFVNQVKSLTPVRNS